MARAPRQLIAPQATPFRSSATPANWYEMAVARLGLVAAFGLAVGVLSFPLSLLRQANLGPRAGYERPFWLIPAFIIISFAMLLLARTERLSTTTKLNGGIAYFVAIAVITGVFRHSLPYTEADVLRGFSPIVPAILFFVMLVPMRPGRIAGAATLAALCDPLTLLGWILFAGYPVPPWNLWLWLFAPNAVGVGLAVVVARFLYSLGESLERAQRMGRYQLKQLLGRGGMGEVWLAEHDMLARPAALKLIRPDVFQEGSEEEALARFEREAQATAQLDSPHTIKLYDYGVTENGVFFYVMELLEGRDLEQLLSQANTLPPSRAVYFLEQICHSLGEAHEAGFIHRDIKPANIYVCRKGSDHDFVKVLDFGLAKRLASDEVELTQTDGPAGTPAYMSPETVVGEPVDFTADVYAIGCVAYRMIAGEEVFDAPTTMALLLKHVQEEPRPLSAVAPQVVPPALEELIMTCLAKKPERRPAHAGAVLAALRQTKLGEGWTPRQAADWWDRHPAPEGCLETDPTCLPDSTLFP